MGRAGLVSLCGGTRKDWPYIKMDQVILVTSEAWSWRVKLTSSSLCHFNAEWFLTVFRGFAGLLPTNWNYRLIFIFSRLLRSFKTCLAFLSFVSIIVSDNKRFNTLFLWQNAVAWRCFTFSKEPVNPSNEQSLQMDAVSQIAAPSVVNHVIHASYDGQVSSL